MTEDLYTARGSYSYFLTINSKMIKEFPRIEFVGQERFYYSCGDGPKPAMNGISYTSSADSITIIKKIEEHISGYGFQRMLEPSYLKEEFWYSNRENTFQLQISKSGNGYYIVNGTECF